MNYTSGSHTVFHHRYHIVWITKDRFKVRRGVAGADTNDANRLRRFVREHVQMFVEIPPHLAVSGGSRAAQRIGRR
jgi:putative transposase